MSECVMDGEHTNQIVTSMRQTLAEKGEPGTLTLFMRDDVGEIASVVTYGMPLRKLPELAIMIHPAFTDTEFSYQLSKHGLKIVVLTLAEFFTRSGLAELTANEFQPNKSFVLKTKHCMIRVVVADYAQLAKKYLEKTGRPMEPEQEFYDSQFFFNTQLYNQQPPATRYLVVTHLHFGNFEHRSVIDYHEMLAAEHRWPH